MNKFVAPLQAVALLLLCSGMAWVIFVIASINPTPPTAMDLQARNTQDLSFANMNSTAMALVKQMLAEVVPSPTGLFLLPITGRETATPSPSAVMTLKPVFTLMASSTPTFYVIPPTATREKQNKPALTATYTPAPTDTLQPRATYTSTKLIPTYTAPSPTDPPTTEPTATPVPPDPTHTSVPPTDPPTLPPPPTDPPPTLTPEPVVPTEPAPTQSTP